MTLRILISLAISAICLYFATRNIDWPQLKHIITGAKFMPLVIGFLISLVTFWLRALRWQILLQPFQKIPWPILFRWQIGGLLISNLLPLRMGEFARAYWAGHKSSIPKSTIFATIVVERTLDVAFLALITTVLLLIMGFGGKNPFFTAEKVTITVLIVLAVLVSAILLARRLNWQPLYEKLKSALPEKISSMMDKFIHGFSIFKDMREFAKVALLSPVIWSIDISVVVIISRSLDLGLTWMQSGLTMAGLILGVMIPAAPGSTGTYEAGGVAALMLLGFEKTISLSFVFLLHAFQLIGVILLGVPILMIEGFNPKKLFEDVKANRD